MSLQVDDEELELDISTVRWLVARARESGCHPAQIAAAILRDVAEEDETAHKALH